jgi:outer membrane protein OmpA-like peptidoglycan-associated protein
MMRLGAGLLLAVMLAGMAFAQSTDDIIEALEPRKDILPKPVHKGLPFGEKREKGVTIEGEDLDNPPSIDLHVPFDYNSDKLTPDGITILRRLGEALKNPRLGKNRFRIAGHTDAKGTPEYNQSLSERRAAAVRDYLIYQYDIETGQVEAAGYGEIQLADPSRPEDRINRRVQVINIGTNP